MQVSIYSNGSQEYERAASLLKAVHLDEVVGFKPIIGISSKFKPIIKNFKFTNFLNVNYGISGIKII